MLVFAHMMKTAGSSLSKSLIGHFGWRMHTVSGGLALDEVSYGRQQLEADLAKLSGKVNIISGHPLRPWIDWGEVSQDMSWFTFLREPTSRYVSHFFFDMNRSRGFRTKRFASMKRRDIVEW